MLFHVCGHGGLDATFYRWGSISGEVPFVGKPDPLKEDLDFLGVISCQDDAAPGKCKGEDGDAFRPPTLLVFDNFPGHGDQADRHRIDVGVSGDEPVDVLRRIDATGRVGTFPLGVGHIDVAGSSGAHRRKRAVFPSDPVAMELAVLHLPHPEAEHWHR